MNHTIAWLSASILRAFLTSTHTIFNLIGPTCLRDKLKENVLFLSFFFFPGNIKMQTYKCNNNILLPQLWSRGGYSWCRKKRTERKRNSRDLEFIRKKMVPKTVRPSQETTQHCTKYHKAFWQLTFPTRIRSYLLFTTHIKTFQPIHTGL